MRFLVLMISQVYQPKNGRSRSRILCKMPRDGEDGPVELRKLDGGRKN